MAFSHVLYEKLQVISFEHDRVWEMICKRQVQGPILGLYMVDYSHRVLAHALIAVLYGHCARYVIREHTYTYRGLFHMTNRYLKTTIPYLSGCEIMITGHNKQIVKQEFGWAKISIPICFQ